MSVQSRDIYSPGNELRAPLSRKHLYKAAPGLRAVLGIVLIGASWYSTIIGVHADATPLELPSVGFVPGGIIAGIVLALLLTIGEWLTSEKAIYIYIGLLVLDAWYTQRQIDDRSYALVAYHLAAAPPWAPPILGFVLSWLIAIAVARFGELLLFGRRS